MASDVKSRIKSTLWHSAFLFVVFWVYIIVGGIVFKVLEHESREEMVEQGTDQLELDRKTLLSVLWAQTIASTEDEWLLQANERLDLYEQKVKEYLRDGIDLQDDQHSAGGDEDNPWTFIGSIFYCYTVVTTIGYGNLAPATATGRVLTVIYGTCGIPLTLVLLAEIGKLLTLVLKAIHAYRQPEYLDDDDYESDEFSFALHVSIGLTAVFLVSGTILFSRMEGWSWIDALYFSFVTFSTIGFGDMVPAHQGYALLCMAYSLTALSLMAMCITALQVYLDSYLIDQRQRLEDWYDKYVEQREAAKAKRDDDIVPHVNGYGEEEEGEEEEEVEDEE